MQNGMFEIVYEWIAWRHLRGQDSDIQDRLIVAIEALAAEPHPASSKRMRGEEARFSLRVGPYRVLYTVDYDTGQVVIADIGHRREIYRG